MRSSGEFGLSAKDALIRQEGDWPVIEPTVSRLAVLATLAPLDAAFHSRIGPRTRRALMRYPLDTKIVALVRNPQEPCGGAHPGWRPTRPVLSLDVRSLGRAPEET